MGSSLQGWVHRSCQEPAPVRASHGVTASFGCMPLLWRGVLHGLQVDICSTANLHGLQVDIYSTANLHGLQVDICSTANLHGLQASGLSLCSLTGHPAIIDASSKPLCNPVSQNHRITESYRLEKTFKIIESNHKPNTAKNHHYTMSLSTSSKRPLNTSRDGDSTTSLGSLFQCLITLSSKPPLAQLEAISSCPITCYLGEETDPHLSTTSFQAVVESDKVSPQPPFLQAKQSQLPQPLLIRLLLQTLHQLRCPSLYMLQYLNIPLVVGGPKLNTVFEGHDHFPSPAGHAISHTSQDAIGFLGHLGTLLAHIQAALDQHPQVLFCQAACQPLFPKPVALHGLVVAQVQDLALSLVEPHTIDLGPSIQPVQVPLQSLPPLKQINTPTQLGVICKLTEGALDPFIQIIDKDIKQEWPQHGALGNTACDRPPNGVNSIHHHSLGPAIQPVLYPAKSTPVQAMSSQFLQENAVGNRVKGFTEV
ncbi:hypothetical protein QYF61_022954 [Mycteria americana]|uniref:Uncharacterized protein n=1 Tax=Mycteria americana TaxID=33587 RepID=A0AAN7PEV7_MYCAM|nr:hypothetical protein QYF61_022954 [Mycteria americana]